MSSSTAAGLAETHAAGRAPEEGSGWAPLREPSFRRLWLAQFVSNVGSWMQTVAAQWVMLSLTTSAVLVGAIATAGSLPVFLFAIPAGALGDLVDRRRLILVTQVVMLVAAAALALLAALSALTPALILALLFVIGSGTAASSPTWQTLQPELVPGPMRTAAIALGSVNQNLARAIGPAIGGILLAVTSAAVVFGVNAASFVVVVLVLLATAIPLRTSTLPREHTWDAIRAGGRYVAFSPSLVALIVRAAAFIFPAGAIWALLPLVARSKLGLGSTGYGLLLGCVGLGAFAAATFGPAVRRLLRPRVLYASACAIVGLGAVVLAVSTRVYLDAGALVVAGAAWITALGLLGAVYQSEMPSWVKARGLSYYLIAFQGSNAIGGLTFGAVAQAAGLETGMLVIAAFLAAAILGTWWLALPAAGATDLQLVEPWPFPQLDESAGGGPVMVVVTWPVAPPDHQRFLALARDLRDVRRRTGATSWRLYRSAEQDDELVESFIVGSWTEHERQHARISRRDQAVVDSLDALLEPGRARTAEHLLAVREPRRLV